MAKVYISREEFESILKRKKVSQFERMKQSMKEAGYMLVATAATGFFAQRSGFRIVLASLLSLALMVVAKWWLRERLAMRDKDLRAKVAKMSAGSRFKRDEDRELTDAYKTDIALANAVAHAGGTLISLLVFTRMSPTLTIVYCGRLLVTALWPFWHTDQFQKVVDESRG